MAWKPTSPTFWKYVADLRVPSTPSESFREVKKLDFFRLCHRSTRIRRSNVPYRYLRVIRCPWTHFKHCFNVLSTFQTHNRPLKAWEAPNCIILALWVLQKGKWPPEVIFHDFFKLLRGGPRWYFRYVEMFLGHLEGILSPRIHFRPILERHQPKIFSSQN